MVHTEPVHLACELFAKLLEEILTQEVLLQRLQNSRFNLVAADRQMIPARPLITCTEAREAIGGAHHEPGAAHAALRQAREQIPRSIRGGELSGLGDRMAGALLLFLRGDPEIIGHDAEMGNIDRNPL